MSLRVPSLLMLLLTAVATIGVWSILSASYAQACPHQGMTQHTTMAAGVEPAPSPRTNPHNAASTTDNVMIVHASSKPVRQIGCPRRTGGSTDGVFCCHSTHVSPAVMTRETVVSAMHVRWQSKPVVSLVALTRSLAMPWNELSVPWASDTPPARFAILAQSRRLRI